MFQRPRTTRNRRPVEVATWARTAAGYADRIVPFVPLSVDHSLQRVFKTPRFLAVVAFMESREENALNEVDRITVAVGYLRDLLVAATEAELRAKEIQRSADGPPDQRPLP
jgi:hypothetical protein